LDEEYMWSYYGSKAKIAKLYPAPRYKIIVEPFSGAAWYSLYHIDKISKAILNEKDPILYNMWEWLIKSASSEEILSNLDFYVGDDISELDIHKSHKDIIGFSINRGSIAPKNIVQKWSCQSKTNPKWASTTSFALKRVARLLPKVKTWEASFGDYLDIPNIEATWFVDPPYESGGEHYVVNDVDYQELSEWCRTRKGQVIVCENSSAKWMDFKPIVTNVGQRKKTTEVFWTK